MGPLAALLAGALLAACGGSPVTRAPEPTATPLGPRADRCGLGLVLDDPNRGFDSAPIAPAAGELLVDVLLVEDASGAGIERQPITYAGRLRGTTPGIHAGTGKLLLEAAHDGPGAVAGATSGTDAEACRGSVRLLLSEAMVGAPYGRDLAPVSATLGDREVTGGECWALRESDGAIFVECSLAGVRHGQSATAGILWLRLAWAGDPVATAMLPDWADRLLELVPTPRPELTTGPLTWTVTADDPSFVEDPGGCCGGRVEIRPQEGTIRYLLDLPVVHRPELADPRERPGGLSVAISSYAGPGDYDANAIRGEVRLRGDDSWAGPSDILYALSDCRATIGGTEREGVVDCAIGPWTGTGEEAGAATGRVSASWQAESVVRNVGVPVAVTWQLGDSYRSEGSTTVHRLVIEEHASGIYDVPDVRVGGTPSAPEVLRIHILSSTGDGTYTGEAVLAMIDNVTGMSPQIVVQGERWRDAWSPLFGDCVVTIADSGMSGEISCPGRPTVVGSHAGSTTLEASWRVGS